MSDKTGKKLDKKKKHEQNGLQEEARRLNLVETSIREASVPKLAHEFRTRLTIMQGALDNVIDGIFGPLNDEQEKHLCLVVESVDRMMALVEDLMVSFSDRPGTMRLNFEDVSLQSVVRRTVDSMRSEAYKEGITLIADVIDEKIMVRCDPAKIEQVLINLLRNSIKFTSRGGAITIRARDAKNNVEVTVMDTGVGIPAEKLEKICSLPEHIDELRDADGGFRSSGLGLIIVREIIDAHHGEIKIDSAIGKGTKFTFSLNKSSR